MPNKSKLVIISLGKRNAGKSNTWYEIFGRIIRTGWKRLVFKKNEIEVFVRNASYEESEKNIEEDVFVKNSSFEEAGGEPEDLFNDILPNFIFCSVQYNEHGMKTINWFKDNGYYLYIQWLNPGYYDNDQYPDSLEFEKKFAAHGKFTIVSGKEKANRAIEIKKFLYEWLSDQN